MIEETYKIGVITRTHGTRGELSMNFTDDVWDRADSDYVFLVVDGIPVPFFLEEWRFLSKNVALMKFENIDSLEAAKKWIGCEVRFPYSLTPKLPEDYEYTWQHFTGWEIVDRKAGSIGFVDQVEDSTSNVVFCLGNHLIPANEAFITRIDSKTRTLFTDLPEGLLEL